MVLFALAMLLRWREEGRRGLLLGCCWLVGWTMACKYTTWYMCAGLPLGALVVLLGRRLRPRVLLREVALACAVLAAPVLPWLIRQWAVTGDPLYPNLYHLLKIDTWSDALQLQTTRKFTLIPALAKQSRLLTFLQKPWHLVNDHHFYLLPEPYSPLLLLPFLIALALPSSYRGPRKLVMLAAAVGYFSWALVPTPANEGRYLAAVAPLLALAATLALEPLFRRRALATLAMVTVGATFLYTFQLPKLVWDDRGPGPAFMTKNGTIGMTDTLNAKLPPHAKLYFMFDNRALGLERERWVDTLYEAPASMEVIRNHATAAEAAEALRALGFTHIVIDWPHSQLYFDNPKVVVHPKIHPRSSLDAQRRRLEELLDEECALEFELDEWKVYRLERDAPGPSPT
jgi:4-amino-4-deoxy-L-arabinose transferase-like glycosyltransferase